MEDSHEFRFEIESFNPTKTANELVVELTSLGSEIEDYVKARDVAYQHGSIVADRDQSFPVDPATAYLIVTFVGGGIAGGFLNKLGEDIYDFLKSKIRGGSIKKH
jgi:hypothetical protein